MEIPLKIVENQDKPLKLNKLSLTRSGQKILDDIDLELPNKGVVVLLGANGAGKSTLLNVLAGLAVPDKGEDFSLQAIKTFLMPEPAAFYPHLTVSEQLCFVAKLFALNDPVQQVEAVMSHWQLNAVSMKRTQQLSLGYRQRLSLAQLSLADAQMLLLDEPMNGMDPEIMAVFKAQVMLWKKQKLLIVATHIMHDAQALADWVVVMFQGRVIYSSAYQNQLSFIEIYQNAITDMKAAG